MRVQEHKTTFTTTYMAELAYMINYKFKTQILNLNIKFIL